MQVLEYAAKLLEFGFAGFAVIMAVLAYRLLASEQAREGTGRKTILEPIQRYMRWMLAVMVLAIMSSLGGDFLKAHLQRETDARRLRTDEAKVCRDGLSRLIHVRTKIARDYDSLLNAVTTDVAGCQALLKALERENP